MRLSILPALLLSLFLFSCGSSNRANEVRLSEQLPASEVIPDTLVLPFGTAAARPYLLTGWSSPEKQGGQSFVWAISQSPAFFFKASIRRPMYLHLRISSFYDNSAEVFVNKHPVGRIEVGKELQTISILVPADVLVDSNVVEFQFAESRSPLNGNDPRKLAAAFYTAIVTPSKYATGSAEDFLKDGGTFANRISVNGKLWPAIESSTGSSIYFYEKLQPGSSLQFGTYFHPSPLSEDDDFASFSVYLRRDGAAEQRVYYKRSTEEARDSQNLPLTIAQEGLYQVEMRIERGSIFNGGETAWISPVLTKPAEPKAVQADPSAMEALRRANRNANVIIMLLDAGGAKHFSGYGYPRNTTPVIDALAREGIQFTHAYTQAVYTLASTSSLMSGLDPYHHRVFSRKTRLPAEALTLSERFLTGEFETGTFVSNGNASSIFGLTQGFQEVAEVFRDSDYSGWGKDITNHFTAWLDQKPNRHFFAYLHYREPHGPYNPPPEWKFKFVDPSYHGIASESEDMRTKINRGEIPSTKADRDYIEALYDANLNYGDYEVGRVLQKLKDLGIYDNTVVLVTADHGEAMWEHDFQGHNSQIYEESIHIPIILKLAAGSPIKSRKIDAFVRTIDDYPTFVDLMDLSRKDMKVDGRSFLPYIAGAAADDRPVISQTILEQQYCYKDGNYKYMVRMGDRKEELYNLATDPNETKNLMTTEPVMGRYLRSRLFGWLADSKKVSAFHKGEKAIMDDSTLQNLKALGYVDD